MIVAIGLFIFGAVVTTLYLIADRSQRRVAAGQPSGVAGIMQHLPPAGGPGPAVLPQHPVRLPGLDVRRDGRRDLGRPRLGPVLGLGPQGDLVVHHLGGLRDVPARQGDRGLARARAAWIQLAGFACLLFNVVGVNLWITGLHSYAGMI